MKGYYIKLETPKDWEGKLPLYRGRRSARGYAESSAAWSRDDSLRSKGFSCTVMRHVPVVSRCVEDSACTCSACGCRLEVGASFYQGTSAERKPYCLSCLE